MNDLLVLCYHGISETWPASTSVKPGDFERQLSGFVRRGYLGATFSDALTAPSGEKTLVVSFDDAHRSVLTHAAPVMARLGIPGTVYVPTDYPGADRPMAWGGYDVWLGTEHELELRCMDWDELRGLAAQGWEVGSHTRSHPRLSQLGDAEIAAELAGSRRECEERMGEPCRSIAYPYSDYDGRVVRAAAEAGYRFAATVPRGPRPPLPLEWPRVGVYHGESARRLSLRAHARRLGPSLPARAALALRRLRR
jgi:peptidoglycan/xylan/chitin deacetylase (PgdA/CDA1 family)